MSAQTAHVSTGLPASIFREAIVAIVHLDTLAATAKQVRGRSGILHYFYSSYLHLHIKCTPKTGLSITV